MSKSHDRRRRRESRERIIGKALALFHKLGSVVALVFLVVAPVIVRQDLSRLYFGAFGGIVLAWIGLATARAFIRVRMRRLDGQARELLRKWQETGAGVGWGVRSEPLDRLYQESRQKERERDRLGTLVNQSKAVARSAAWTAISILAGLAVMLSQARP